MLPQIVAIFGKKCDGLLLESPTMSGFQAASSIRLKSQNKNATANSASHAGFRPIIALSHFSKGKSHEKEKLLNIKRFVEKTAIVRKQSVLQLFRPIADAPEAPASPTFPAY